MKLFKIFLVITVIILSVTAIAVAQPGSSSPPAQAPIDSGLGILVAIGGTYVVKKLRDRANK